MDNIAYVVKIFFPPGESDWEIGGIFDEQKYALELKEWLEGNTMMEGCVIQIDAMHRNTAYV